MLINGFNEACKNIYASYLKVGDESMSAIRFRMTAKDNLPHLSYILHKPETLGGEFKTLACYVKGDLLFIEVQRRKEVIKHINYPQKLGENAACTKRMTEATKGIGQ